MRDPGGGVLATCLIAGIINLGASSNMVGWGYDAAAESRGPVREGLKRRLRSTHNGDVVGRVLSEQVLQNARIVGLVQPRRKHTLGILGARTRDGQVEAEGIVLRAVGVARLV